MAELSKDALRRLGNWLGSHDTGVSSETMAAIAMGADPSNDHDFDAPHDGGDFGRCYRLLKAVPEIREHFARIGELVPQFAGILANWEELSALYERDKPKGRSDELYERIRSLRNSA